MKGIHLTETNGRLVGVKFAGALYLFGLTFQATAWNKKLTINVGKNILG